ncbi:MAG: hypothetical protein K9L82_08405 [Chromatiaceae bacterium]|nr:hypothetical protein [Chromatiaceae bacterium]MCF8015813.1 hypothetical protein [Chromatiaceae bacterium]
MSKTNLTAAMAFVLAGCTLFQQQARADDLPQREGEDEDERLARSR